MNTFNISMLQLAVGGGRAGGWIWAMAIGFVVICIVMMLVILIQKPKGGGLSGAFGGGAGGGSTQAVIGARVGDLLTVVTVICFVLFLVLAMGMTWAITSEDNPPEEETDTEEVMTGDDADTTPSIETVPLPGEDITPELTPDTPDTTVPPAGDTAEDPAPDSASAPEPTPTPAPAPAE